ncbi:small GTP-binding domain protein, partial [Vibrio parahaemolyticus VPTS-2010_2]
TKSLAKLS